MVELTTKDKLMHIAAQQEHLANQLFFLARDSKDISFAASHELGITESFMHDAARRIIKQASKL